MSILKRGAMALAVLALVGVTLPAVVGSDAEVATVPGDTAFVEESLGLSGRQVFGSPTMPAAEGFPAVAPVVVDGYQLTWSRDYNGFLSGEPFTPGIVIPHDVFYVFLSPQEASSVTWNSDGGVRVYNDDGYPWREVVNVFRLGGGDHVLVATVDGDVRIEVPFTLGKAGTVPVTTVTTAAEATTAVTVTTTTKAPQVGGSFGLTWSRNSGDFLSGEPFTPGIVIPYSDFYVFLSPQEASSVTWNSDNGVRVYNDDGYPWREKIRVSRLGGGDHVLAVTVDGQTTFQVPFTLGSSGVPAVFSPTTTTTRPKSTTTTKPKAPGTTTTTQPKSTTTTVASKPVSGVVVRPGESIQGAVNAHPVGTTFVIMSGVHKRQSVIPKSGNTFVGESGAVLSGEGVTEFAFGGNNSDNVTVRGLVIEKYATPTQQGVIRGGGGSTGWLVEGNEIRNNGGTGIRAGAGWKLMDNFVHHNGQLGVFGVGVNIVVAGNEVAFNNTENVSSHWEAGGSKFVHTTNLVVRDNYVHDNKGPGLWTDGHNIDTLYEKNRVIDNYGPGINHELSHDAVIRNNVVEGNGFGWTGWVDGAGILVNVSPNVEVYGNTVRFNNDGIAGIHTDRDSSNSTHGKWELRNLWVHDNIIAMNVGHSGMVTNTGSAAVFTTMNNRFDRNTYTLGSNDKYYRGKGGSLTTTQWKATGQDPNSTWK